MRRNDVASTSFRRRVPIRFLINQCQIITFLILKYHIRENSRIELRGIVLPVQMGGLLGGPKGMLAPPSQIIGGGGAGPPPPLPPPLPTPTVGGISDTAPAAYSAQKHQTANLLSKLTFFIRYQF